MRFLADMNVDVRVVGWLRENGHDVKHLRDEGLQRLADAAIFAKAGSEHRVLLTFDLDFAEIAAFAREIKVSVVLFRLHNTRVSHVISRLAFALEKSQDALEKGAVVVLEESRHRIRYLPIGEVGGSE